MKWTEEDDKRLVEIMEQYKDTPMGRLEGFEVAEKELSKPRAECAYHWYSKKR